MTPFKLRPRNHGGITTHVLDVKEGNEMTQPPEKLYLQWIGTEYKWTNFEEGDVTWCEHIINDDDTAYIRADIVDGLRADKAMTGTCELCDMRDPLAEILEALEKLSTHNGEVNTHISAAENHLETADFLLEGHYCTVPKWDGPDTAREART